MRPLMFAIWLCLAVGCEREDRPFSRVQPERSDGPRGHTREARGARHVTQNAYALSEGQRLFEAFNCSGCHGGGGGGHIGPALTDAAWRYGASIEEVHRSITEGRPLGMPAFGALITDPEIWQLSAYVLSLSGRVPEDIAGSRPDGMSVGEPPVMRTPQVPNHERVHL